MTLFLLFLSSSLTRLLSCAFYFLTLFLFFFSLLLTVFPLSDVVFFPSRPLHRARHTRVQRRRSDWQRGSCISEIGCGRLIFVPSAVVVLCVAWVSSLIAVLLPHLRLTELYYLSFTIRSRVLKLSIKELLRGAFVSRGKQ